jgi:hypothetical protein
MILYSVEFFGLTLGFFRKSCNQSPHLIPVHSQTTLCLSNKNKNKSFMVKHSNGTGTALSRKSINRLSVHTGRLWRASKGKKSMMFLEVRKSSKFNHSIFLFLPFSYSKLAQRKRVGLITQRSEDRNLDLLSVLRFDAGLAIKLLRYSTL